MRKKNKKLTKEKNGKKNIMGGPENIAEMEIKSDKGELKNDERKDEHKNAEESLKEDEKKEEQKNLESEQGKDNFERVEKNNEEGIAYEENEMSIDTVVNFGGSINPTKK